MEHVRQSRTCFEGAEARAWQWISSWQVGDWVIGWNGVESCNILPLPNFCMEVCCMELDMVIVNFMGLS